MGVLTGMTMNAFMRVNMRMLFGHAGYLDYYSVIKYNLEAIS